MQHVMGVDRLRCPHRARDRRSVRRRGALQQQPASEPPRCGSPPAPPGRPQAAAISASARSSAARSARWVTISTGASAVACSTWRIRLIEIPAAAERRSPPAPARPARRRAGTAGSRPPPRRPRRAPPRRGSPPAGRRRGSTSPRAMSIDVAHDRRGGRPRAGARAAHHDAPDEVALDHHHVGDALELAERRARRHQAGLHPRLEPRRRSAAPRPSSLMR